METVSEHSLDLTQRNDLDLKVANGRGPSLLTFRDHQPVRAFWVAAPERGEVCAIEGSLGLLALDGDGIAASPKQDEIDLMAGLVAPVVNAKLRAVRMDFVEEEMLKEGTTRRNSTFARRTSTGPMIRR